MFRQRKFEVRGRDRDGDLWIITTDVYQKAEQTSESLRRHGYHDVKIFEPVTTRRAESA